MASSARLSLTDHITRENYFARKRIPAVFHMIAAAEDSQLSEEVYNVHNKFRLPDNEGREGGACTSALLDALYKHRRASMGNKLAQRLSWVELLKQMSDHIKNNVGLNQTPHLASSRMIDIQKPMCIVPPSFKGNRRAVLIGINYTGQNGELKACHNDVNNMKTFLKDILSFKERDMLILMDDGKHYEPTHKNIVKAFKLLVKRSQPGDVAFIHFSGHGGQTEDLDGDESDGWDETLIPVDFMKAGHIVDDDILRILVAPMSKGVYCTVLVDCCHSGTVLDLPYNASPGDKEMEIEDEVRDFKNDYERIKHNDKHFTELVLDGDVNSSNQSSSDNDDGDDKKKKKQTKKKNWLEVGNTKHLKRLCKVLPNNVAITHIRIIHHFFNQYDQEWQNHLLSTIGRMHYVESIEIQGAKPITLEQLYLFIDPSEQLRQMKLIDCRFKNTAKDYSRFRCKLDKHKTLKDYHLQNCAPL